MNYTSHDPSLSNDKPQLWSRFAQKDIWSLKHGNRQTRHNDEPKRIAIGSLSDLSDLNLLFPDTDDTMSCADLERDGIRTPLLENSDLLNSHCKIPKNRPRTSPEKQNYLPALEKFSGSAPACTSEYQFNIHFQNYNPMAKNSFRVKFRDREVIWKKIFRIVLLHDSMVLLKRRYITQYQTQYFLNNGTGTYI